MITDYKKFILLERKLNIELLSRPDKEIWWDNFIKKLSNNEPFFMDEWKEITISNSQEIIDSIVDTETSKVDKQKAYDFFTKTGKKGGLYKKNIETTNGEFISLKNLERTKEFGSSGGSSAGTKKTRINETIQSIYLSIRQKKGENIIKEDIINFIEEFKNDTPYALSIYKKIGTNVRLNIEDLDAERGWMDTHLTIANEMFNNYLDEDYNYNFYQSFYDDPNSVPSALKHKFYDIIKEETKLKIDISKWNPSDIFIVCNKEEYDIIESINNCENIEDLNNLMDGCFNDKQVIGISLKKINQSKDVIFLINKEEETLFKYSYSTSSASPMSSMSINIYADAKSTIPTDEEQILTSRIFTDKKESNIVLEIKGKSTKYGKVSLSYLNKTLLDVGIEPIPTYKDKNIQKLSNDEIIDAINKYYGTLKLGKTYTRTNKYDISNTRSKLISKLQSLILVDKLEKNKNVRYIRSGFINKIISYFKRTNKSDYVIKQLFYYAYAMGNEIFDNCKYIRINNF